MRKYSIVLFAIVCLACTSLNKQRLKTVTENSQNLQQNEQQVMNTKTTKVLLDTNSAELDVAFWPKGIIKYSPITGFEGEAYQIKAWSKQKQSSLLNEHKEQNLSAHKEIVFKQEEQSKIKTVLKDKIQHYFWLFGFLLTAAICIIMVYLLHKGRLVWVKS
jgi:hypothetical protein